MDCEVTAQYYILFCPHKNMYSLKCTELLCVSYGDGRWSVTPRLYKPYLRRGCPAENLGLAGRK